ncbi:hypothetical protein [Stenotrophomonas sp. CFBP 13725]|uniref:hypothetical protein n=1 Tax=Stenotrophomonas sp. CFBP 13725 TaxID=2775297 RepID=UPI001786D38D|nr:hypothetical protein [Stenotrophomonas sp. CFBP 13725]MBD8634475.1 hypothetical protein [Stenotrophomonas sp. CFBP 13725]
MDALILASLGGAVLAVSVGLAKFFTRIYDYRQAVAVRSIRQSAYVAQASAQVRQ